MIRPLTQCLVAALFSAALLPFTALAAAVKCVQNGQVFYAQDRCPPDYQLASEVERPALNPSAHETQQAQQRAQVEKQRLPKETAAPVHKNKKEPHKKEAHKKEVHKKTTSKNKPQKHASDPKVFKAKAHKTDQ